MVGWFGEDGPFATGHKVTKDEWNHQRLPYHVEETGTNVANTAALTALHTLSIPASTFSADGGLRCTMYGEYWNDSGAGRTLGLQIDFGATTLYNDVSVSITNSATVRAWYMTLELNNLNATNSQALGGLFTISAVPATTGRGDIGTAAPVVIQPIFGTSAQDTTTSKTLTVSVQHAVANASLLIIKYYARTEVFPAA